MTSSPDHPLPRAPETEWRPTDEELLCRPKKMRSPERGLHKQRGPMKDPHFRAVVAYLRDAGATRVRAISGGKHPRIAYEWKGEESSYVMACSPRDPDVAARNAIRDLRRKLERPRHSTEIPLLPSKTVTKRLSVAAPTFL